MIIAAGDADPAELARLITKWFSDWRGSGPKVPTPAFGDPVAPAGSPPEGSTLPASGMTPVGETRVIVEPELPRGLSYAVLRPWRQVTDSIAYNQGLMLDSLSQALINRRLEAKARAGGSFLFAQVQQQDVSRSVDGTFVTVTPLSARLEERPARCACGDRRCAGPRAERRGNRARGGRDGNRLSGACRAAGAAGGRQGRR